jgi:non-homologous end joining protein Ku
MEEELKQLEKISNDRTKKIDILEFHPKESVNISFLYKESIVP